MKIRDVMSPRVIIVPKAMCLLDAARVMASKEVGFLIVSSCGQPAGVITDRDIVVRAIATGVDYRDLAVADAMTTAIYSCADSWSVEDAARLMARHGVCRLVVVNRDRNPIGVVSLGDIASRSQRTVPVRDMSPKIATKSGAIHEKKDAATPVDEVSDQIAKVREVVRCVAPPSRSISRDQAANRTRPEKLATDNAG